MKYRIMPAGECPHQSPILAESRNTTAFCLVAEDPFSPETRTQMEFLVAEFGANSEAFLRFWRKAPSKYVGTGSGEHSIATYIRPYLINQNSQVIINPDQGAPAGFFFDANIEKVIRESLNRIGAIEVDSLSSAPTEKLSSNLRL